MDQRALETLIDKREIIELFNRYAMGIDTRDRALYRSCFTERLCWDMMGQGPTEGPADDWVETALSTLEGFQATQHNITNHMIEIDGDRATAVAYLQSHHWNPDAATVVGGYYTNELTRTPQGWRISRLALVIGWTQTR